MSLEGVKTETDFNNKVKASNLTIVGFFSPKCDFCKMLLPIFESQPSSYPMIQFLKVRPSELPSIFNQYAIRTNGSADLPQIALFRNGETIAVADNILNQNSLNNFIKSNFKI